MQVVSHRGYWIRPDEKNTEAAFIRSFELGFGTETDVRDCQGELVIAHDPPRENGMLSVARFFEIYSSFNSDLPLALNIKADGLQLPLKGLLVKYGIKNYFVFDMSVPDGLQYFKNEFTVFTRMSEYETQPTYLDKAQGVWLDQFKSGWFTKEIVKSLLRQNKKVCIVSPELHGRPFEQDWTKYKSFGFDSNRLMICTDFPERAREFFHGEN